MRSTLDSKMFDEAIDARAASCLHKTTRSHQWSSIQTSRPHSSNPRLGRFDEEPFDYRFAQAPNERLFIALCDAYSDWGSIAWGEDLSRLMEDFSPELSGTKLACLLAADEIFHLQWRGSVWIPMAQFHLDDLSIDLGVQSVRRELGDHLDGWEMASWFVCGNDLLEGRRPLDVLARELPNVLQAARADRFAAVG